MQIQSEFGTSTEVSYLVTTTFLLGYVFGVRYLLLLSSMHLLIQITIQPLVWGPGSELAGRRPTLMVAMTLYTLFHLGQGLAHNIETLLVTRFLSGFFAVAPLTNTGG